MAERENANKIVGASGGAIAGAGGTMLAAAPAMLATAPALGPIGIILAGVGLATVLTSGIIGGVQARKARKTSQANFTEQVDKAEQQMIDDRNRSAQQFDITSDLNARKTTLELRKSSREDAKALSTFEKQKDQVEAQINERSATKIAGVDPLADQPRVKRDMFGGL